MHKLSSSEIIARMKKNRQPCVETMGGEVLEVDQARGWIKMRWLARPEFCHSGNIVQGGFITGMVDSSMAHAAMVRGLLVRADEAEDLAIVGGGLDQIEGQRFSAVSSDWF